MNSPAYTSDAERCFLRALNPTTGEELDPVFECTTPYELDRLVRKSAEAFEVYSAFPGKQRQRLLETIAFHLESNARPIIERAHAETGLPMSRLEAEMARTCFQLRFLGSLVGEGSWVDARIDHGDATRKPQPKPDVRSMFRPVGPVAVFGAANFPLAFSVAGGDTASALAAGNTVLFKVHPGHPGTSELVGQAICRALKDLQMPDSTFALLFDTGGDIGGALVKHPLVKAVGFTGSRRVARMLMDIAASRPEPIPVFAEMGSVNPIFILPDAMSKRAAEIADGVHASVTLGVGQFCTKPGLVILQAGPGADTFKNRLAELISATPAGVMLTPAIQKTFQTGIESLKSIKGVSLVAHGKTECGPNRATAILLSTTAATFLNEPLLAQEVFGPGTLLVLCNHDEEMLNVARAIEGQLTASVHATEDDLARARDLIHVLEERVGRLIANGFPTGVEVCNAMVHGGPYPACSDPGSTSVGARSLQRFARLVCYQNWPEWLLPEELKDANPLGLWRTVDGVAGRH